MLHRMWGKVHKVTKVAADIQELVVDVRGQLAPAVNYRQLCDDVLPGDWVEINTTAVILDTTGRIRCHRLLSSTSGRSTSGKKGLPWQKEKLPNVKASLYASAACRLVG